MKATLNVYKRRGETPLECLERLHRAVPELGGESLTYAGRLDPLAEGVLIVLVGEEAKRKEGYLGLRKSYRAEILFGFGTDTFDIAGKLTETLHQRAPMLSVMKSVGALEGPHTYPYPPYSSKPVMGKPLFQWAREDRLHEITLPLQEVTVYRSLMRHSEAITGRTLGAYVSDSLGLLRGDFRQEEIGACWERNLGGHYDTPYDLITLEVDCSSGTYVRTLARELGKSVGLPALAYRIVRTSVGSYTLEESAREFSSRMLTPYVAAT